VAFINSDPGLVRLFLRFLDSLGVEPVRMTFRLQIHENADMAAAEEFWRKVTGARVGQFKEPTLKRHNPKTLRKKTGEDYHGCLVVVVAQSAELYQQIAGWAEGAMAPHAADKSASPAGDVI
jgi:hypothetical protein